VRYDGVDYREVHDDEGPTRLNFMAKWREANGNTTHGPSLIMLRERYPDLSVEPGGSRRCCFAPIFAIQRTIAASLKRTSPYPKIEKRE